MPEPIEGVPVYGWEGILRLAGLASAKMLRHDRKRPADAQKPVGQYWTGYEYHPLFKLDEAVDLPTLSPGRQRLYDANRTCARCSKRSKYPWEKGRDGKRLWREAQQDSRKETFAILAACRAADQVPALLAALEALLAASWRPAEDGG